MEPSPDCDDNIHIGSAGEANEFNMIRIGNDSTAATFVGGINGINGVGLPVLVSAATQPGITFRPTRSYHLNG
jgi:hypothetical protein